MWDWERRVCVLYCSNSYTDTRVYKGLYMGLGGPKPIDNPFGVRLESSVGREDTEAHLPRYFFGGLVLFLLIDFFCVFFGMVRWHQFPEDEIRLVPYLHSDGASRANGRARGVM
jgi:hypothetical protein